jgi:hypothetical protein
MAELLSRMGPGELIPLVAIVGGLICGIITVVGVYLHRIRQTELKKDMVYRGMSAEEIETVLAAGYKR